MLATKRLASDHKAFLHLLDRLEKRALPGGVENGWKPTFLSLLGPLQLHSRLEEEFLFPALDEAVRTTQHPLAKILCEQHRELADLERRILEGLSGRSVKFAAIEATAKLYRDRLRRNMYLEETMAFPLAEALLGAERLEKMSLEMDDFARRHRRESEIRR